MNSDAQGDNQRGQRSSAPTVVGLVFWFVIALVIAWFTDSGREFIQKWWWALGLGIIVLILIPLVPHTKKKVAGMLPQRRAAFFTFLVIPIVVILFGGVLLLHPPYDIMALRIVFLLLVTLFPAILYYLFVSTRRFSLLNEFLTNLDRLGLLMKRRGENEEDKQRRLLTYLQKFRAAYGLTEEWKRRFLEDSHTRYDNAEWEQAARPGFMQLFAAQTTIPVLLTTIIVALGWVMTLPPLDPYATVQSTPLQSVDTVQRPALPTDSSQQVSAELPAGNAEPTTAAQDTAEIRVAGTSAEDADLVPIGDYTGGQARSGNSEWKGALMPIYTPVHLAFLGAYFFSLQMLFRRYFRRDLGSNAYAGIVLRIVLAIIGIWVAMEALQVLTPNISDSALLVMGFIIGVFPQVALQVVFAAGRKIFQFTVPSMRSKLPISDLDGLTVWNATRFEEEGIDNIPNMATADFVELLINTKFPLARVIDWVDQAILYTQLGPVPSGQEGTHNRTILAGLGIRTASALVEACRKADSAEDKERLKKILGEIGAARIETIVDTVETNPNLALIMHYRGLNPIRAAA